MSESIQRIPSLTSILRRHLERSIAMLYDVIQECPNDSWTADDGIAAIWEQIYHTICSLNTYGRDLSEETEEPSFHSPQAKALIKGTAPVITREQMLAYLTNVHAGCISYLDRLSLESLVQEEEMCGKTWTPADRIIGQIRHIQHHVGAMHSTLRRHANVSLRWVGLVDQPPASLPARDMTE